MDVKHPHLKPWILLPPAPGKCPECADLHLPEEPHNQQSLFYQYDFYGKRGRWPTWTDAMAHCGSDMKQRWIDELRKRGVVIDKEPQ